MTLDRLFVFGMILSEYAKKTVKGEVTVKKMLCCIACSIVPFALLFVGMHVDAVETIKVGIVDCYTGSPTIMTCDVRDAFRLAAEEINARGGVLGRKIECIPVDTKFRVDVGTLAAKDLIRNQNVDILMGTINSNVALAISEIAKRERIPFFSTFSKSEKITGEKGHRYVFGIAENTAMVGRAAALGLARKPYRRYWFAGDDYEYGRSIAKNIWLSLRRLKPDVQKMGETWWEPGHSDLIPYLSAMMKAGPDAIVFATGGLSMVNLLKQVKVTGLSQKIPTFVHTATELGVVVSLGLEAPTGVMGTSNYYFYYPDNLENRTFLEAFLKRYGRYPSVGALYGCLTARFIEKGYNKAGSLNRERLVDSLEGLTVDSPVGPVRMRACDHQTVLPMFMGVTKRSPLYPFFIANDVRTLPGSDTMPTCEEIMKSRCLQ